MSTLKLVNPTHIHIVWGEVKQYLENALDHSGGEYSLEHLKMFIIQGQQVLLLIIEEDKICGAVTVEWINYPNDRIAFITAIGGKTDKEGYELFLNGLKIVVVQQYAEQLLKQLLNFGNKNTDLKRPI